MAKSKRLFYALFVSVAAIFALFVGGVLFSGCKHQHEFTNWTIVQPATCTEAGVQQGTCQCGATTTKEIPPSHTEVIDEAVAPSCTETGLTQGSHCSVCKAVIIEQKKVDALGHDYTSAVKTSDGHHNLICSRNPQHVKDEECALDMTSVAATCDDDGYNKFSCTKCEYFYTVTTDQAHGHSYTKIEHRYDEESGRHTHVHICAYDESHITVEDCTFEEQITYPDCTNGGFTTHTCTTCSFSYTDTPVSPTGHDWKYEYIKNGEGHKHTKICKNNEAHNEILDCVNNAVVTDPDCTNPGYTTYTCEDCQNVYIDDHKDALGHVWESFFNHIVDTETHESFCDRCAERKVESCQQYYEDVITKPTCENGGYTTKTCRLCKHHVITDPTPELTHDWGEWQDNGDGNHIHICNNDNNHVQKMPHTYSEETTMPTCTDQGYTTFTCICGYSYVSNYVEPIGHEWQNWESNPETHTATCKHNPEHVLTANHSYPETNVCICGHDGLIYEHDGAQYVVANDKNVSSAKIINIPAKINGFSVVGIKEYAFEGNENITKVTLPDTIQFINRLAFYRCLSLQEINFPESLTTIEEHAFNNCKNLVKISGGDGLLTLGKNVFLNTGFFNSQYNWEDGNEVLYLGKHLLKAKEDLPESYQIHDETISICANAFENCTALKKLTIPDSVQLFNENAFLNCINLNTVEYKGDCNQWFNIKFANDFASPMHYANYLHIGGVEGELELPQTLTEIPAGTFRGDNIQSVVIPVGVKRIGAGAFQDCVNLTEIVIPDSVTYIGKDAFKNTGVFNDKTNTKYWEDKKVLYIDNHLIYAEGVEGSYSLKSTTVTISSYAFVNCPMLTDITITEDVAFIGNHAFEGCALKAVTFEHQADWYATIIDGIGRIWGVTNTSTNAFYLREYILGDWRRQDK